MQTKLTAALVRRHTETDPPARDASYFDTQIPRLALRVKPPRRPGAAWAALYFVRYTAPGGAERRAKVGDPRTMTLDQARAAAKGVLARVDAGGDPAADTAAERAAWTVREAWAAYAASRELARKAPRTQTEDGATARLHVLRHLGADKLAAIDVPAVRRMHRAVEADQRTNARKRRLGGTGAARRAVRVLSALMSWAVGEGRLDRNPIIGGLRLDGEGERTTILDQPEQYARLFETMDRMVAEGRLRAIVRAFVVLLAATGMRRNEARTLVWGDIDLGARRITLRDPKVNEAGTQRSINRVGIAAADRCHRPGRDAAGRCCRRRSGFRAEPRQRDHGQSRLEPHPRRGRTARGPGAAFAPAQHRDCRHTGGYVNGRGWQNAAAP